LVVWIELEAVVKEITIVETVITMIVVAAVVVLKDC